jgi:hypothetical protein
MLPPREALMSEVRSLCRRVHNEDWVMGWEFALWRCITGKAMLQNIGYPEMASLLALAREAGGWVRHEEGDLIFVSMEEWRQIVKTIMGA